MESSSKASGSLVSSSKASCPTVPDSPASTASARFVPAYKSGKPETIWMQKHFLKKPQKVKDDQPCRELPIWMQNMIQWMDHQMKTCQQTAKGRQAWVRRRKTFTPRGREWTHQVCEDTLA
jgi:hypothetical protein